MGCDLGPSYYEIMEARKMEDAQANLACTKRELVFTSIEQATRVLRPYKIQDRIRALQSENFDLTGKTRAEIGKFIGASRERTTLAMQRLGLGKKVG